MQVINVQEVSNEVLTVDVGNYVSQFNQFSRKTAEAVIGMGTVVYQAKQNLDGESFESFCRGIRFKSDASAIRKLTVIGKMAEQLSKHADKLPSTWTTLYQLTQLGNEVFEDHIENGKVFPAMSGFEAKQLVDLSSNKPTCSKRNNSSSNPSAISTNQTILAEDGYAMAIKFAGTPTLSMVEELQQLIKQFSSKISFPVELLLSQLIQSIMLPVPAQQIVESGV